MDHPAPPRIAPPRLPTPPRLRGGAGALVPCTKPTGKAALAIAALAAYQKGKPFLFLDTKAGLSPAYRHAGPFAQALDQKGFDVLARITHTVEDAGLCSSVAVALFWNPSQADDTAGAVIYAADSGAIVPLPFDVTIPARWDDPVASADARLAVLQSALAWFGKALLPIGMAPGQIAPWMFSHPDGWGPTRAFRFSSAHAAVDPAHNPYAALYQGIGLALAGAHDTDYAALTLRGGIIGPTGRWSVLPEAFYSEPRTQALSGPSQWRLLKTSTHAAKWGRALVLEACATGALPLDVLLGWSHDLDGRRHSLLPYPRTVIAAAGCRTDFLEDGVPSFSFPSAHARMSALQAVEAAAPTTMAALRAHPLPRIL